MAQIIPLQSRARASRPEPPHQGGAQILFFLGVRYMRMEDPLLTPGGARKRKAVKTRAVKSVNVGRAPEDHEPQHSAFSPSVLEPKILCIWRPAHMP